MASLTLAARVLDGVAGPEPHDFAVVADTAGDLFLVHRLDLWPVCRASTPPGEAASLLRLRLRAIVELGRRRVPLPLRLERAIAALLDADEGPPDER